MGQSLEAALEEVRRLQSKRNDIHTHEKCRLSQVYLTLEKNMSKNSKSAQKPSL